MNIDYEDLDFVEEGVKIYQKSKTDQFGEGYFSTNRQSDYCPVVS